MVQTAPLHNYGIKTVKLFSGKQTEYLSKGSILATLVFLFA